MIFECTGLCKLTIAFRTARSECSIVPSSPILSAIKLSQLYSVHTVWASSFVRPHVIKFSLPMTFLT